MKITTWFTHWSLAGLAASRTWVVAVMIVAASASCREAEEAPPPVEPAKPPAGRPDTKSVQALDLSGYDSKPIRKTLDKTLDAAEKRDRELNKSLEPE